MQKINEHCDRESWLRDLALSLYYMRDRRGQVDSFLDLVGERLAEAFHAAGIPEDVFQNVVLDHATDRKSVV